MIAALAHGSGRRRRPDFALAARAMPTSLCPKVLSTMPLPASGPGALQISHRHARLSQRQIARHPCENLEYFIRLLVDEVVTAAEGVNLPCRIVAQTLV